MQFDRQPRWDAIAAAAVHLLTASGAVLGLLALMATARHDWIGAFIWLGLAVVVDGIDGPLARATQVERVLPRFGGDRLDLVIDYLNYCMIPAFILVESDIMAPAMAWTVGAAIAVTSLFHFADRRSKTADACFVGFPVIWNFVVFYFFALGVQGAVVFVAVAALCILTFVPIKWPHPVRVRRLRPVTLALLALWGCAGIATLAGGGFPAPLWVKAVFIAVAFYIAAIVVARTVLGPAPTDAEGGAHE